MFNLTFTFHPVFLLCFYLQIPRSASRIHIESFLGELRVRRQSESPSESILPLPCHVSWVETTVEILSYFVPMSSEIWPVFNLHPLLRFLLSSVNLLHDLPFSLSFSFEVVFSSSSSFFYSICLIIIESFLVLTFSSFIFIFNTSTSTTAVIVCISLFNFPSLRFRFSICSADVFTILNFSFRYGSSVFFILFLFRFFLLFNSHQSRH